jgi:hypothetical protein
MTDTIIAKAVRTFPAPRGYKGQLIATAQLYKLGGNQKPYFSVTCDISTPAERARGDGQAGGCMHEEIAKVWPAIKPVIDLHLSDDDGAPMHAAANGFYWLAKAAGISRKYEPEQSPEKCFSILLEHLRISAEEGEAIKAKCLDAFATGANSVASSEVVTEAANVARRKAGIAAAEAVFTAYCETLRPRWQQQANDALAIIRAFSTEAVAA